MLFRGKSNFVWKWLTLFIFFCWLFPHTSQASDNDDFLFWSQSQFYWTPKETPKFSFFLQSIMRLQDNASTFMEAHNNPGFYYKLYPWFKLGFINGFIYPKSGKVEYRPLIEANFNTSKGKWNFYNRNRFENRITETYRLQYRLRLTIGYFIKRKKISFQPYMENEIFLQNSNGFHQNRAAIGNEFIFLKGKVGWSFYYMLRSVKQDTGWIQTHILGHIMKFYFP